MLNAPSGQAGTLLLRGCPLSSSFTTVPAVATPDIIATPDSPAPLAGAKRTGAGSEPCGASKAYTVPAAPVCARGAATAVALTLAMGSGCQFCRAALQAKIPAPAVPDGMVRRKLAGVAKA